MEQLNHIAAILAVTLGAAWASGINLYAAVLVLGWLGATGHLVLPPDLQILADPLVLFAAAAMYLVEFIADKVPGVDTSWDVLHTFIRIPAGAAMAAGAIGDVNPAVTLAAALIGGGLAAGTHAAKAGSRVMINTSPEPVSNWIASIGEDVTVIAGLWLALHHPWVFLSGLGLFLLVLAWLLPKLWSGIKKIYQRIVQLFRGNSGPPAIRSAPDGGDVP